MLAYTSAGKGPAVVLLHGFPLSSAIWEPQLRYLAARYRVIAPDLPGLGASPVIDPPSMAAMARAVLSLLDDLNIERAAVAGHSMGGYVALAVQKEAPNRVAGLGMVASQAADDTPEARAARHTTAEKVRHEGVDVVANTMGPKLFGSAAPESPEYQLAMALMRRSSVEGVRACLAAMADREDSRSRLPEIAVPTLVLAGDADKIIPLERSEAMAAAIPHAILVKAAGAGHMPMLERPDETNRALERWLSLVW